MSQEYPPAGPSAGYPPEPFQEPVRTTAPPAPAPDVPFGTSSGTASSGTASSGTASSGSTREVAKEQANAVGGTAKEAGQHVAEVARDQAGGVAEETRRQAGNLFGRTRDELTDQAAAQQSKLAGNLRTLGEELRSMAERSPQSGPATDLVHQASEQVGQVAGWLDQRDPGALVEEVRRFARRRPGAFLAIAAGAGLLAGRLTRGAVAQAQDDDGAVDGNGSGYRTGTPTGYRPSDGDRLDPVYGTDPVAGETVRGSAAYGARTAPVYGTAGSPAYSGGPGPTGTEYAGTEYTGTENPGTEYARTEYGSTGYRDRPATGYPTGSEPFGSQQQAVDQEGRAQR